jgi:hypothetical protein
MSLHISVVAIRGDHISKAGELLRLFGYGAEDGPIEVTGWDAAARHLGDHSCKAVYFDGEWTVIVDPELVLMTDEATCAEVSRRLGSQMCGLVCEGVSGTYGFNVFRDGRKVRGFCSTNGVITEDEGASLPEETEFEHSRTSESGVIATLARIGFDYWGVERADRVLIYCPSGVDISAASTVGRQGGAGERKPRRSWWRFW